MQSIYNFYNIHGNQAINFHLILPDCAIYIITMNLPEVGLQSHRFSFVIKIRQCLLLATLAMRLSRQLKEDIISSTTVVIERPVPTDFRVLCDSRVLRRL